MKRITFQEWLAVREGLWLADKNAVPGMSRINPFPATQAQLKRNRPKPAIKSPQPAKPTVPTVAKVVPRPPRHI